MSLDPRHVEALPNYLPNGVSAASFDPEVLRFAAKAHNSRPFGHDMQVKAWVILYLLDKAGFPDPDASDEERPNGD